jgi:hypothetical protein
VAEIIYFIIGNMGKGRKESSDESDDFSEEER